MRNDNPRFESNEADKRRLIKKFITAVYTADEATLLSLFAEDATSTADGGGKVTAARKTIVGRRKLARLYYYIGLKGKGLTDFQIAPINGESGIVTIVFGQPFSATVFDIEGEKILRVYQVMNPEKLKSFVDAGAVKKSI